IAKIFDDGNKWALLGHGASVETMIEIRKLAQSKKVDIPAVYDFQRVKPLNEEKTAEILAGFSAVAVLEENYMAGGLGEAIGALIAERGLKTRLMRFGVPDVCVKHATQSEQRELYGLTAENVIKKYLALEHEES
ncbi:MAG: hypothetical protein IJP85_05140, partial [Synergistaceae bacterium]|nr:hypothetical protein [Synergistaceae bacterium]